MEITKLVRSAGPHPDNLQPVQPEDLDRVLGLKLVEEALELAYALMYGKTGQAEMEAADVLDVLEAIRAAHRINMSNVEMARSGKFTRRGGFEPLQTITRAPRKGYTTLAVPGLGHVEVGECPF